ncbi:c-type cytochrome [Microvirga massiliensis]|uniref:c-type cytochrome n=1 Tax=Microvirga massiliensis TaxID=1033741 RepID=UPI00062B70EC|nr:c-type cytochrome [Microvirga massiliensis]
MRTACAVIMVGCLAVTGCDLSETASFNTKHVDDGDADRGHALVASGAFGCAACHVIPGVRSPRGNVGPPLDGMASRGLIAGELPNKPGVLVAFLQDPPALVPRTGMPDVGLTLEQSRDIAAYLYTLEPGDEP